MTRIAISVSQFSLFVGEELILLKKRLAMVPMIVYGSPRVQISTHAVIGNIGRWVMVEGYPHVSRVEDTNISVEIRHVPPKATKVENYLAARASLIAIWATLDRKNISNPNALVVQGGKNPNSFAEGGVSDLLIREISSTLDEFRDGAMSRSHALVRFKEFLPLG